MQKTPAHAAFLVLASCVPVGDTQTVADPPRPTSQVEIIRSLDAPGDGVSRCYARDDVSAAEALNPDARGIPALWFEIPCEAESDPDFIASLQRALAARGLLSSASAGSGTYDDATRQAIAAYQLRLRLRSGVLSLIAARQLGLALWVLSDEAG